MKYNAHEWLERYYHYILMHTKVGTSAKEYLHYRGINEDTLKLFKLGYAPVDVRPTLGILKSKGFSFNNLVDKKVLSRYKHGKYKGKLTDPFKNRIIFPIQNFRGKTVGFGGRTLDKDNKIKYINTPETEVFVKGDNVYGFSLAKEEIKNQGFAILFEGYFDVITAHQSNIKNAVATLGTALTLNQALLIKSVTKSVVITFDGDDAGMEASFKSASVLESVGCNVQIAYINDNLDPDDFIKKYGKDVFMSKVITQAKSFIDSFIEFKKGDYDLSDPSDRYSYASEVLHGFSSTNTHDLKNALNRLGMILNVPLNKVYEELKREG